MPDFFNTREDYSGDELTLRNTPEDPFTIFGNWIQSATKMGIRDANAMALSTIGIDQKTHCRIVLMKEFSEKGFTFFTNYQSDKALQIDNNAYVSLLFFWKEIYRQVRIEGITGKISDTESDKYFNSRPIESRINAIVSPQSREIHNKSKLTENAEKLSTAINKSISRPDYWGGYRVKPEYFEFWQGQPNRLHDRITYTKQDSFWRKKCLAP